MLIKAAVVIFKLIPTVMKSSRVKMSEDEAEIPAGVTDTMFTKTDFIEDSETKYILSVAPGEGNKPLSIF